MTSTPQRLPLPRVLAWATLSIPLAGIGLPLGVFLSPFYAENMGVGVATTGAIFMALRIWDLLIDPVMGHLVDTRPSRLGRIRHWLILAVPILAIATFFLYLPMSESASAGYLIFWLLIFFVGFTLFQTPTLAWVPAIATTYDERSRVFMWFEVINVIALLGFLIIPELVSERLDVKVNLMGAALIIMLPITVVLACRFVPDPPLTEEGNDDAGVSLSSLKGVFANGPLVRILIAYVSIGIAVAGTGATYLWAAKWGYGLETGAGLVLAIFFISGMGCLPLWVRLSERLEKHTTVMVICFFSGASFLIYLPLREIASFASMSVGAVLSGVGFSAAFTLLRSMLADLIEVELAQTGTDRSGFYYALLSGAFKTGASMAIGIPYILLGVIVGFNPNAENSPETVNGLMYVFVGVPFLFYCIAGIIIRKYPITRASHEAAIRAK